MRFGSAGSVSSFSRAGYHVLSDLGMWFAQVGLANWRPIIVKDAMYDVMQRLHNLWHACIYQTRSHSCPLMDTETLGSSERLSEDYVSSPLLAEVTNCCANMTWLSWTTIWIILYLHDFEILFRRFCVVFFTRWVSCVVWTGHVVCTGWACQLTSNNCQRCYVWCYAAAS